MAYKDITKRRQNWMRWYERNRESFIQRNKEYNKTEAGKESAINRSLRQKEKNPVAWKARQAVRSLVYQGKIEKLPCEICGEAKTQAHHEDYNKPLDVIWLCSFHHKQLHKIKPLTK